MIEHDNFEDVDLLKTKVTKSFSILIVREFSIKMLSFLGQLVVARILLPSDFGYFVMVSFVTNFFLLFSDVGLTWALIRNPHPPTEEEISAAFFVKTALSIGIIIIIFIAAPFIPLFYSNFGSTHIAMVRLFSITLLLTSIRSLPVALLEREIKYNVISIIDIIGALVYQAIVIPMALWHFGAWSFIYAVIGKEVVEAVIAYAKRPIHITFRNNISSIHHMMHFGVFLQGNGILAFIHTSIIPLLIGVKYGPYQVGLLDWASGIASIPLSVTDNFGRVAFAGFSRVQHNRQFLSKAIERSIGILSIITLFFTVMIFGFGVEAIKILYTQKWVAGVPSLYWFAANTFFISAISALGSGILALGKSKRIFYITLISDIVEWSLALVLVAQIGFIGVAVTSTITTIIVFCLYAFAAHKSSISLHYRKLFVPKGIVSGITLILILLLNTILPSNIVLFGIKIIIASICYLGCMYLFAREDTLKIIQLIGISQWLAQRGIYKRN